MFSNPSKKFLEDKFWLPCQWLEPATKSPPSQTLQIYQDAAQIPNYATEKIAAATEAGWWLLTQIHNKPNRPATRAGLLRLSTKLLIRKVEPIQSEYNVRLNP